MRRVFRHTLFKNFLKIAFVLGLLTYLVKKGFFSVEATKLAFTRLDLLLPAYFLLSIGTFLGIWRWQILLAAQGIHLTFFRIFQLNFIGNFFNIALPGAVSGDFVKAVYVAKEVKGARAKAFSSIFLDRVVGVAALVMVSVTGLFFSYHYDWGLQLLGALKAFIGIAGTCVVAFFSYLFFVKESHDPVLKILKSLETRFTKAGSLTRIYEGLRQYQESRRRVIVTLLISGVIHVCVVSACVLISKALGESLHGLALLVVVPMGLLVTAIPVAPAGVGTGHVAFAAFFHLIGSERGADIFNVFILFNFLVAAFGGVVYLRFKSSQSDAATETSPS